MLVVGAPSTKGLYSLARLLGDLLAFGVPPQRLLTVCNRGPRSPRQRAAVARALAALLEGQPGVALPSPLPEHLAAAVAPLLARPRAAEASLEVPVPVAPGALGLAAHDEEDVA